MSLLSQINVITHHVLGIASYNQKGEGKKKKKLSREKTAGQCSGLKNGKKKENMRRKNPLHWKWKDLDFHCHFIFILCDLAPSI